MSILSTSGIQKTYGDLNVLKGIDLEISAGEIVSIVGSSGAGKSTLLHILGTIDRPDSGTLHIQDVDVFKLNDEKLAAFRNLQLGFVFQFHHLLPELTAAENVLIPSLIAGKGGKAEQSRAAKLLEIVGLKDRVKHKPSQLSGGEQQRVAVARALMNNPSLVFADEPTGNLDSTNATALHELFIDLKKKLNQTFVIVTHNNELAAMSDRIIHMRDGRIAD